MSLYAIKNDKDQYRDGIKSEWADEINSHCVVDSVDAANDWNHTCANPLGEVVKLVEEPENGNITSEETVEKVFREANRRVHNLISDDQFKFEIKMALNAYKPDKKPAPVVVSQEEDEMLKRAKNEHFWATNVIQNYIDMHMDGMSNDEKQQFEDRLMRAYVIGWTVNKPKLWNVKVPHTADELYWKRGNRNIGCTGAWRTDDEIVRNRTFTDVEIEHYGLQDCEKREVKQDE